ncbi:MAG: F-type H+-transporting ATPase subunit delta [Aliidongia sp.]|nr:F-type H+-transporting ATPase subunit delta [Aliidongia sp.]
MAACGLGKDSSGKPPFPASEGKAQLASEATGLSGLAGRYATALFDLADQEKALDAVAADLRALGAMIAGSADLTRLIRSPVLSRDSQAAAMAALLARADFAPMTRNFVGLVARNRRLFALPDMIAGYLQLLAQRRGEIRAEVTAAQEMSPAQVTAINDQLKRAVGSKVAVEIRVDPAIIGGLVVKVGSRMVDGSLRSKLHRLQLAMRGI